METRDRNKQSTGDQTELACTVAGKLPPKKQVHATIFSRLKKILLTRANPTIKAMPTRKSSCTPTQWIE